MSANPTLQIVLSHQQAVSAAHPSVGLRTSTPVAHCSPSRNTLCAVRCEPCLVSVGQASTPSWPHHPHPPGGGLRGLGRERPMLGLWVPLPFTPASQLPAMLPPTKAFRVRGPPRATSSSPSYVSLSLLAGLPAGSQTFSGSRCHTPVEQENPTPMHTCCCLPGIQRVLNKGLLCTHGGQRPTPGAVRGPGTAL